MEPRGDLFPAVLKIAVSKPDIARDDSFGCGTAHDGAFEYGVDVSLALAEASHDAIAKMGFVSCFQATRFADGPAT